MTIYVQNLDSALLYAFLWLWGEAQVLKLEKKASMKHLSWLLIGLSCVTKLIAYILSGKIVLRRQRSSSDKRWI